MVVAKRIVVTVSSSYWQVINPEGFIKFSSIYEGNTSDSQTLPDIIEGLRLKTSDTTRKATVVLDAGIATADNLKLLEAKGYNYVCVSRKGLKDYQAVIDTAPVTITTKSKQELTLQRVSTEQTTDSENLTSSKIHTDA